VPDCDIWALLSRTLNPERQSARITKITVWRRMLYSCTHMATVGVNGLRP